MSYAKYSVRAFGDIERNKLLQDFILKELPKKGYDITIFIGDILVPYWGKIDENHSKFFYTLMERDFTGKTRAGNFDPNCPVDSYKQLLKTLVPFRDANLSDNAKWNKETGFNYRSYWYEGTPLIGYSKGECLPSTIFILGNKEVQLVYDIYNRLLIGKSELDDKQLRTIYDYVNHCMDFAIIDDTVYLHNAENWKFVPLSEYCVAGHCHKNRKVENVTYIDTSFEKNSKKFVHTFGRPH